MSRITVIGAGVVGICCALTLQRRGHTVLLVDRSAPASETSFGNAGVICDCGIHPLADPALIPRIPRLLANRDTRFQLQYGEIPWLTPWLTRALRNMNSRTFGRHTTLVADIAGDAVARHKALMREAGSIHLLNDTGWLKLYRQVRDLAGIPALAENFRSHGVSCEQVNTDEIRDMEPDLGLTYAGGLWMNRTPSVRNPHALAESYYQLFIQAGGMFRQASVDSLTASGDGWRITTPDESRDADAVVMAAGPWSNALLAPLGVHLPFVQERGYHMMFSPQPGRTLHRAIIDPIAGIVMNPMASGIRVSTGANITARESAPNPAQLNKLMPLIRQTFPMDRELLEEPWMGRRTSTADSLPLIGPIKKLPGVFIATGHSHLGLTLAPITAEWVADAVDGQPNPRNEPFLPDRT